MTDESGRLARIQSFCAVAVTVGAFLRLVWLPDMEYKGDEHWIFDRTQAVGVSEGWPAIGIYSGPGLNHPPFGLWVMIALGKLTGAHDPVALVRAIAALNVGALVALLFFATLLVEEEEREPWLWGIAMVAVSPMAVILSRKIWVVCLLAPFCVAFLVGWWKRESYWGAFLWGLAGSFLPQVHMGGFFSVAGFFGWEITTGWLRERRRKPKWIPWAAGTALGILNLVPWVQWVRTQTEHEAKPASGIANVVTLQFFRQWVSDALGTGADYSLGSRFLDLLRYPVLDDPSRYTGSRWAGLYPMLYAHGVSFACGAFLVWTVLSRRGRGASWPGLVDAFRARSESAHTVLACFLGYGLLITLANVYVWRHYMLLAFPLQWVSLGVLGCAVARRAQHAQRKALGLMWVTQLLMAVTLLHYIHENHGVPGADYGTGFRWQGHQQHR